MEVASPVIGTRLAEQLATSKPAVRVLRAPGKTSACDGIAAYALPGLCRVPIGCSLRVGVAETHHAHAATA